MTRPHDSWAEVYDLVYREEFGSLYDQLTKLTVRQIGRAVAPPASIVDFGAGSGRLAIPLARAGYRLTAVEPSPQMLRQLRLAASGLDIDCVESTMQDFRSAERFDLATCVFTVVIYLLGEPELRAALANAAACLRRGGLLLLDVPTRQAFASHGCNTERLRRNVVIRPLDGDIHEYSEEIEMLGPTGVEGFFEDRFLIRHWQSAHVLATASECGLELVDDLSDHFAGSGSGYYLLQRS